MNTELKYFRYDCQNLPSNNIRKLIAKQIAVLMQLLHFPRTAPKERDQRSSIRHHGVTCIIVAE